MKVEPVITFRNLSPVDWIEEDIRRRVRRLQASCTEMTACRVLVEVPHRHRKHGNRFHIRLHLTRRGREISVGHAPDLHTQQRELREAAAEKHAEIERAFKDGRLTIRQVFDRARRRLQDYATRQQAGFRARTSAARRRHVPRAPRASSSLAATLNRV